MNLPNKITLARIFLIPVFVLFFYLDFKYHELVAAFFFALAALTDFLDGYIARSRNLVTNMGKFLDPIADKVLVSTALILILPDSVASFGIFVAYAANAGRILAGICVALIIARELIIGGFRLVAVEKRAVIAADKLGKIKTVLQDVTIFTILVGMAFLNIKTYEAFNVIALILLMLSTLLTVVSGANYIIKNRQVLTDEKSDEEKDEETE